LATMTLTWADATDALADEIGVFADTDTLEANRIRGLTVSITPAGVVTIQGRAAQFFKPNLWELEEGIDGDDVDSYLDAVQVYWVHTYGDTYEYAPVVFGWQDLREPALLPGYGVLQVRQPTHGTVTPIPALWNVDDEVWEPVCFTATGEPNTMELFYLAGWPLRRNRMQEPFARAVATLATALLAEPICGCDQAERFSRWSQQYPNEHDPVSYRQLDCPWGKKNGAWEAYRLLSAFWGGAGSVNL